MGLRGSRRQRISCFSARVAEIRVLRANQVACDLGAEWRILVWLPAIDPFAVVPAYPHHTAAIVATPTHSQLHPPLGRTIVARDEASEASKSLVHAAAAPRPLDARAPRPDLAARFHRGSSCLRLPFCSWVAHPVVLFRGTPPTRSCHTECRPKQRQELTSIHGSVYRRYARLGKFPSSTARPASGTILELRLS
jgi:hypothetical protein